MRKLHFLALAAAIQSVAAHAGEPVPNGHEPTRWPIKHLVVIFQENVSFDHYFGTYPHAANPPGEPAFTAAIGTPTDIDNLTDALLNHNPNASNPGNEGQGAPFRLDRSEAMTADQDHDYTAEQAAFNDLKMDAFPRNTGRGTPGAMGAFGTPGGVMGYFDGNTVTALWNYAQHYAMSDHFFESTFGPSTPGAINLISGQTNGAQLRLPEGTTQTPPLKGGLVSDGTGKPGSYTVTGDPDPAFDTCSDLSHHYHYTVAMRGQNIGDQLNAEKVSWGFFSGGFRRQPTAEDPSGCRGWHRSPYNNLQVADYVPHHEPFQYYASTANPDHTPPASVDLIGSPNDTQTHHQYDVRDFHDALQHKTLPAVSFLKAPSYQDGHAGYSNPLDEQMFLTETINAIEASSSWPDTAIIIAYDDSDGWYDHANAIVNGSASTDNDPLKACQTTPRLKGWDGKQPVNGRCGYGPRLPLLVISPYARHNYVDHTRIDQTSILRFIQDNWLKNVHGKNRGLPGSLVQYANSLEGLFDFSRKPDTTVLEVDPMKGSVRVHPAP